jgi:hypothetical protein
MTHMRYWALTLATALAGGFIAITKFAFVSSNAIWIMFAVAIAAAVFSAGAVAAGLLRDDHAFSGTSALSALVAGFTIIATRAFNSPTALWLAFAGGSALLLLALRALALHETTIERVVHQLEVGGSSSSTVNVKRGGIEISGQMRSWLYWLSQTGVAVSGAFVVASTFIWRHSTGQVSPRWLALGVGAAAASIGLAALADRGYDTAREGLTGGRIAALALTATGVLVAGALIAVMAAVTTPIDVRWWAFGLGAGIVGVALAAAVVHELTSERVRHELEVSQTAPRLAVAS